LEDAANVDLHDMNILMELIEYHQKKCERSLGGQRKFHKDAVQFLKGRGSDEMIERVARALAFVRREQMWRMSGKPANEEMVQGYIDGFNLDDPAPSENRSESYRHGFANGRADKTGKSRGLSFDELTKLADLAMQKDAANVG
jgi:hypothetical protein